MTYNPSKPPPTTSGASVAAVAAWAHTEFQRIARILNVETRATKTVDADYTLKVENRVLFVDTDSAAQTTTLMLAREVPGMIFTIANIGTGSNDVTVEVNDAATETIGNGSDTTFTVTPGGSIDIAPVSRIRWTVV